MKLKHTFLLSVLLLALFLIQSCIQGEYKIPTKIRFVFAFTPPENMDFITFDKGLIRISEIEFEGYRETGDDYFFTHRFSGDFQVNIGEATGDSMMFDVPQGVYQKIKVKLLLNSEDEDPAETEYGFDKSAFHNEHGKGDSSYNMDFPDFTLMFTGSYHRHDGHTVPVVFLAGDEIFEADAAGTAGNSGILLTKEKEYEGVLTFNPHYAFQFVSRMRFEQAEMSEWNGYPAMLISKEINEDIFEIVLFRLQESFDLNIN